MCRECPELVDSRLTRTEIDLIFVKVKKKGERRINYARFLDALGLIAAEKYPDMVRLLARYPKCDLTRFEAIRAIGTEIVRNTSRQVAVHS